jgi:hypothetical protein
MVLIIIGLVLVGWTVLSIIVAILASTVFRGARIRPETIVLPPDVVDLTDPPTRTTGRPVDHPGQDIPQ